MGKHTLTLTGTRLKSRGPGCDQICLGDLLQTTNQKLQMGCSGLDWTVVAIIVVTVGVGALIAIAVLTGIAFTIAFRPLFIALGFVFSVFNVVV